MSAPRPASSPLVADHAGRPVIDSAHVDSVRAFLKRVQRLDPAALVRLRGSRAGVQIWAALPFTVLAGLEVPGAMAVDRAVSAADLDAFLLGGESPPSRDRQWRGSLPVGAPEVIEEIPSVECRRIDAAAAEALRSARGKGVGDRRLRDLLLDQVVITVIDDADHHESIPLRLVMGLLRMGFVGENPVQVTRVRGRVGLATERGSVWSIPTSLNLLLFPIINVFAGHLTSSAASTIRFSRVGRSVDFTGPSSVMSPCPPGFPPPTPSTFFEGTTHRDGEPNASKRITRKRSIEREGALMAWWRKRESSDGVNKPPADNDATERPITRPAQPNPIPAPRHGDAEVELDELLAADDPNSRWDIIKRDLMELDPDFFDGLDHLVANDTDVAAELTHERLAHSLRRLSIRYLMDESGALLAMWERHVLQIRREGPAGEILVLRARAYSTVPAEWEDRAYRSVNEWNRTRRFLKAYIGDPTESGQLPIYGETQIPVRPGISDELLDEFVDCAAAVSGAFIDWLYDEGGLL